MAGELQYRPFPYDDWGMIRNADGSMFATVSRPEAYEGEFDQHREEETDPFAELARRVIFFESLERENATLRAERDEARGEASMLQDILDGRPAINGGLPDTYIKWSQSIYSGDVVRASFRSARAAAIRNMGGGENG